MVDGQWRRRVLVGSEPVDLLVSVSTPRPGCVVLRPDGDIDRRTVAVLREVLFETFDSDVRAVVVDLDAVAFLGAKGVGLLLDAHERALAQGVIFVLAGGRSAALRALQVLGIMEVLSHHVSVGQAVSSIFPGLECRTGHRE